MPVNGFRILKKKWQRDISGGPKNIHSSREAEKFV
jgi:hypothetical protein